MRKFQGFLWVLLLTDTSGLEILHNLSLMVCLPTRTRNGEFLLRLINQKIAILHRMLIECKYRFQAKVRLQSKNNSLPRNKFYFKFHFRSKVFSHENKNRRILVYLQPEV